MESFSSFHPIPSNYHFLLVFLQSLCKFTFGDGVVLGHPAGHHGVLAQPVNVWQRSDPLNKNNLISAHQFLSIKIC